MAFLAGQLLSAQFLNETFKPAQQTAPLDTGTTSSTVFTTSLTGGTSPVFINCEAPLSGKIECSWAAGLYISTGAPGSVLCGPQVREGSSPTSGTIFFAVLETLCIQNTHDNNNDEIQISRSYIFGGMTPGLMYNFCLAYRVLSGVDVGNVTRKTVAAKPIPA